MKKIRSWLKMIRLFFCLAYEMTANYFRLTEDLTHNYEICRRICRKIVKSAHIFLDIEGKENIPEEERFLIVSNHRCFFDVVFMMAAMDTPVSFVAAKELWHYPLLHRYLDSIQCISLDPLRYRVIRFEKQRCTDEKGHCKPECGAVSGGGVQLLRYPYETFQKGWIYRYYFYGCKYCAGISWY